MVINRRFFPKRSGDKTLPPGQYETHDFPVLSKGPTPEISVKEWSLRISGLVDTPMSWNWSELNIEETETITKDIHCVTKWSKRETTWDGVSLDTIIDKVSPKSEATHILAVCSDSYSTNLPIVDITDGKAWIAIRYEGKEISPEHGGPARLFVPHLYFWKSAKWIEEIKFLNHNEPGFWETRGYHIYGDPWKEQRYSND